MKTTETKTIRVTFTAIEIGALLRKRADAPNHAGVAFDINEHGALVGAEVVYTLAQKEPKP